MAAIAHIQKELRDLQKDPPAGFRVEADDMYNWTVWFTGPADTPYAGGQYKASLAFPKDFPMEPPTFRILSTFWHPNVYPDGRVCISILHPPGTDHLNTEETAMMRWTPVQTIRSVLISVVSLLSDPDPKESGAPANVDALVQYRKDRPAYDAKCHQLSAKSLSELPADFEAPSLEEKINVQPQADAYAYISTDEEYDDDDDDFNWNTTGDSGATDASKKYADELSQIRAMGVGGDKDDAAIISLLTESRGDLATVIEKLCS